MAIVPARRLADMRGHSAASGCQTGVPRLAADTTMKASSMPSLTCRIAWR